MPKLPPAEGCFDEPPEGFEEFTIDCMQEEDVPPEWIVPGGRTVFVTPYVAGSCVCAGQYGQFQILNGLGGQIHRALYLGKNAVGRNEDSDLPNRINVTVDCDDTICGPTNGVNGGPGGELGIAVRDRGRWYVFKLAQPEGEQPIPEFEQTKKATIYGGNNNPYEGTEINTYEVDPYRPFVFPRRKDPFNDELHDLRDAWADTDELPDDFAHGDEFDFTQNEAMLPYGLGFARLKVGETLPPYSWNADNYDDLIFDEILHGPPVTVGAVFDPNFSSDLEEVILLFNEPVTVDNDDATTQITLVTTSPTPLNAIGTITAGPTGNSIAISLDRAVETTETVDITILADTVLDSSGQTDAGGVLSSNSSDGGDNGNLEGTERALFKLPKFAYIPILNDSDQVLMKGMLIDVKEDPVAVALTDNTEARNFFPCTPSSGQNTLGVAVSGGNAAQSPGSDPESSYPRVILPLATKEAPGDWQDFNIAVDSFLPADIPITPDGYGFAYGHIGNTIYGEAISDRGKMAFAFNISVGVYVANGDVVRLSNPEVLADSQDPPEYRMIWDLFV